MKVTITVELDADNPPQHPDLLAARLKNMREFLMEIENAVDMTTLAHEPLSRLHVTDVSVTVARR